MIKNRMMPVIISPKLWFKPQEVEISDAPCPSSIIKRLAPIMANGLNCASHETITAVNP